MSSAGDKGAGFSLVEMLVVLIVVGLAGAIGSSALSTLMPQRRLSAAAEAVVSALRLARAQAMRTAAPSVFTGRIEDFPPHLRRRLKGESIVLPHPIRFGPGGWSDGGEVEVQFEGRRRLIMIDWPLGTIKIENAK